MADQTARGNDFERQAEKKLSGWSFLESKTEGAVDLYEKAANCFKFAKTGRESWRNVYQTGQLSHKEPANSLNQAANLFLEIGQLNMAARYCKELGDLLEQEQEIEKAMYYFEQAADLFLSEGVTTLANPCKQKVALFAAQQEH